jgi:hypothetical protein
MHNSQILNVLKMALLVPTTFVCALVAGPDMALSQSKTPRPKAAVEPRLNFVLGVAHPQWSTMFRSAHGQPQNAAQVQALNNLVNATLNQVQSEAAKFVVEKKAMPFAPMRNGYEINQNLFANDARLLTLVGLVLERLDRNSDPLLFGGTAPLRELSVGHWAEVVTRSNMLLPLKDETPSTSLIPLPGEAYLLGLNIRQLHGDPLFQRNPSERLLGVIFHEVGHFLTFIADKELAAIKNRAVANDVAAGKRFDRNRHSMENRADCIAGFLAAAFLPSGINETSRSHLAEMFRGIGEETVSDMSHGSPAERAAAFNKGFASGSYLKEANFTVAKMAAACFPQYPLKP